MLNTSINNCALDNIEHKMLSECPVRYRGMAHIRYNKKFDINITNWLYLELERLTGDQ